MYTLVLECNDTDIQCRLGYDSLFEKVTVKPRKVNFSGKTCVAAATHDVEVNISYSDSGSELDSKPSSIVDGDYSQYCTWDVSEPQTKTSEWRPDTIRDDIDIMESIRHACNRN